MIKLCGDYVSMANLVADVLESTNEDDHDKLLMQGKRSVWQKKWVIPSPEAMLLFN